MSDSAEHPPALAEAHQDLDGLNLALLGGALQLVPANDEKLVRLQRLTGIALGMTSNAKVAPISPSKLRKVLRDPAVADGNIVGQEDSLEEHPIQIANFGEHSYLATPGLSTNSVWEVNLLLRVIGHNLDRFSAAYLDDVSSSAAFILSLGDSILRAAGLREGAHPAPGAGSDIDVPAKGKLDQLTALLLHDAESLESGYPPGTVDRFVLDKSALPLTFLEGPNSSVLDRSPLLRDGPNVLVTNPRELVGALRARIIAQAHHLGHLEDLAACCREAIAERLTRFFTANTLEHEATDSLEQGSVVRIQLRADQSERVEVLVGTGLSAASSTGGAPFPPASTTQYMADRHQGAVEAGEKLTFVLVHEPFGRDTFYGSPTEVDNHIFISALDLEVVLRRRRHPLILRRFSEALDRLAATTRMLSFSTLDQFAVFEENLDSFYLSDDGPPTFVNFSAGSGAALRLEHRDRYERQYVPFPDIGLPIPLSPEDNRSVSPIYSSPSGDVRLVRLLDRSLWVVHGISRTPDSDIQSALLTAVAYWTWQIATRPATPMLIPAEVSVVEIIYEADKPTDPFSSHVTSRSNGDLAITCRGDLVSELASRQNTADRTLVRAIIDFKRSDTVKTDQEQILDAVAPLGPKRMLTSIDSSDVASWPGLLPVARYVESANVSKLLDELGFWLIETRNFTRGKIADEDRVPVLNDIVGHYFEKLSAAVAELSSEGLLEELIERDEALIVEDFARRRLTPARLACFGYPERLANDIREDQRKASLSAIASRFVVEYVVAQPPNGKASLDIESYEWLLALASEIVNKGTLSDATQYSLADPKLSILGSRRLGIGREERYQAAIDAYGTRVSSDLIEGATQTANTPGSSQVRSPTDKIDAAFSAEFGFRLTDFPQAAGALLPLNWPPTERDVTIHSRSNIEHILETELGWNNAQINSFLEHLQLTERATFIPPGRGPDVYPWRFNRALSYVRRPLLARQTTDGSVEYLWGPRRLMECGRYWSQLIDSARLKSTTEELRQIVSKHKNGLTEAFNDQVADDLEKHPELVVHRRLKKIGKHRIAGSTNRDIGDVDVLVLYPKKREIWALETKDFEVARTPSELANEVEKLFSGTKSAVALHQRRVDWIKQHLGMVLTYLHPEAKQLKRWTVHAAIVVSQDLVAPGLQPSTLEVINARRILRHILRTDR